jgi:cytochrome oxidase Cu insertion factor (SCO1/SenC/PrrC family)
MAKCPLLTLLLIFISYSYDCFAGKIDSRGPGGLFISLTIEGASDGDSVTLNFWDEFIAEQDEYNIPHLERITRVRNGICHFSLVHISQIGYISLNYGYTSNGFTRTLMNLYLAEPGDSIIIHAAKPDTLHPERQLTFSGRGSEKYRCCYQLLEHNADCYIYGSRGVYIRSAFSQPKNAEDCLRSMKRAQKTQDSLLSDLESVLLKYQGRISTIAFDLLKADVIGKIEYDKLNLFHYGLLNYFRKSKDSSLIAERPTVIRALTEYFQNSLLHDPLGGIGPKAIAMSRNCIPYQDLIYLTETRLSKDAISELDLIKAHLSGQLRDKVITFIFITYFEQTENQDTEVRKAYKIVSDPFCRNLLRSVITTNVVGQFAANFGLPDSAGKTVHLSDFKGKVVLIDFWFTGCTACGKLYRNELAQVEAHFKEDDRVVFLTINIDTYRELWLKSIKSGNYTSLSATNLNTGGPGVQSEVLKEYKVTGFPRLFLVDKKGRIFENRDSRLRVDPKLLITEIDQAASGSILAPWKGKS